MFSWIAVLPMDVVKSRIQADNPNKPTYKGMWDCIYKSFKTDGMQIFFKGFFVTAIRAFPVNVVIFLGYEKTLNLLNKLG